MHYGQLENSEYHSRGNGRLGVSTNVINEHVFKQSKKKCLHKNKVQFSEDTNMAAVPLFRDTNMAVETSRENTLYA